MDNNTDIGRPSASKLVLLSANVRGWGDFLKQKKQIIHYCSLNPDILCISETKFDVKKERLFRNSFGSDFKIFASNFSSNARGVIIMISKNLAAKVVDSICDDEGRYVIVKLIMGGKSMAIASVYGPNEDDPDFLDVLFEAAYDLGCDHTFIGGDFNTGPSELLDYCNYNNVVHKNSREKLNELIDTFDACDVFRFIHGDKISYTWIADGIRPQKARIDLNILSNNLKPFIIDTEIKKAYLSDHNILLTKIDFLNIKRGRGFWRLDNSYLKNEQYVDKVTRTISLTLAKYVKFGNYGNLLEDGTDDDIDYFLSLDPPLQQGYEFNINPNLLLTMIINDVKNESIGFITSHKKGLKCRKVFLMKKIEHYRKKSNLNDIEKVLYDEFLTEYDGIIEREALEIMRRDKILSQAQNEKPSRFFCSLEKDRSAEKFIPKLKCNDLNGNERTIFAQNEIEGEVTNFYKQLYKNKDHLLKDVSIHEFLKTSPNDYYPSLDCNDNSIMSNEITLHEMSAVLKASRNGAAPGQSGLSFEFYKKFWDQLGYFLTKAANYSYTIGALPEILSRGTISLLPKEGKDKEKLANWRPLTLLSVEYKLIASCIAGRMGNFLPKLIHPDQMGFVKGRFIGESIRLVHDTMQFANSNKIKGLLLLIDFEKAFDSLSHSFIDKCLDFFGFNDLSKKWINILLHNFYANTVHAGNISEPFKLGRGSKQGDPVSSLLFILCVEILSIKISREVTGIKIGNVTVKRTLYADDLTIFINYDGDELRDVIMILNDFFFISGLKINFSKTQCVKIGDAQNDPNLCDDLGLTWEQSFKLLGIHLDASLNDLDCNYDIAVTKILNVIKNWRYRYLTIYGKTTIVKTLLLSKISHLNLVLPCLDNKKITELEQIIFGFLWKTKDNVNGKDRVARVVGKLPERKGGMNLPSIKLSMSAMKLSWLRRGQINENATWVGVLNAELNIYRAGLTLNEILTKMSIEDICKIKIRNKFWESCFNAINKTYYAMIKANPLLIVDKVIWGSKLIDDTDRVMNRYRNRGISENIETICDTLTISNGNLAFKGPQELTSTVNYDRAKLANFRLTIARYLLNFGIRVGGPCDINVIARPREPLIRRMIMLEKKGCSAWKSLVKDQFSINGVTIQEQKWENVLRKRMGVHFWNACYDHQRFLNYNNKQKWLQYQILRKSLMVNHIVSKFKPTVSELCTFCNAFPETIEHLFFNCNVSKTFIGLCTTWFHTWGLNINLNNLEVYEFLFLQKKRTRTLIGTFLIMHIKYFIWIARCQKKEPLIAEFKKWLGNEIGIMEHNIDVYPKVAFIKEILIAINARTTP